MMLDYANLPPVLTDLEACAFLRLDADDGPDVKPETLRKRLNRLVDSGRVRPAVIGKHRRFAVTELLRFVNEQTEINRALRK